MAELPFVDSFAHYNIATYTGKWVSFSTGSSIVSNGGRSGINGCFQGGIGCQANYALVGTYNTLYCGFGYLASQAWSNPPIMINGGGNNIQINVNGDGTFTLAVGANSSNKFGVAGRPQSVGVWYDFEISASMNNTTMSASCRVNGNVEISSVTLAGNFTGRSFNLVQLTTVGGSLGVTKFCDFYINTSGFWGDVIVGLLKPNGVGNLTGWTPSNNSIPNWQIAAGIPPGNNANLVSANNNTQQDAYVMQQVPTNATVYAVQASLWVQKDAAGPASFQPLLRNNTGNIQLGTIFFPSFNSYYFARDGYQNSVFTGNNWTVPEVNSMQFGISRTT